MKKSGLVLKSVMMLGLLALTANLAVAEERQEDHESLRLMLKTGAEALNTRNIEGLRPILNDPFFITAIDQKTFTDLGQFKSYYEQFFTGEKAPLKSITFNPVADIKTTFITENTGICYGTSGDAYVFKNGQSKQMNTKWTATVVKTSDGWKLANLHLAVNALDNPLLQTLREKMYMIAGAGVVVGLVLSWLIGFMRRKKVA